MQSHIPLLLQEPLSNSIRVNISIPSYGQHSEGTTPPYIPQGPFIWFAWEKVDFFTAGNSDLLHFQPLSEQLGAGICYDLRFPEVFRKLALAGSRLIIIPAEWPSSRIEHWRVLLQARAIENQVFIVGVNCTGSMFRG